jgi:hypothetical protein
VRYPPPLSSVRAISRTSESSDVLRDRAVKLALQIPSLLRAFITVAHKGIGVRQRLTAQALAVLDGSTLSLRSAG